MVETKGLQNAERTFTYKQVNDVSNQLAHYLSRNGFNIGDMVMIYAYRG